MSILLPQVYTPDEISSLTVEDWLPAGLEALDPNLDNFDGGSGGGGGGGGGAPWPWWVCGWWRCSSFTRETHKDRVRYHDRSNRTLNPSPQAAKPQTSHPTHPASSLHPPPLHLATSRCATSRHGRQRARTRSATRPSQRRAATLCCRLPRSRLRSNPSPNPRPNSDPDPDPSLTLTLTLTLTKAEAALQPEVMGLSATATFGVHEGAAVAAAAAAAVLPCPAACSGRGQCDVATGLCACDEESAGGDCSAPRAALALSMTSASVRLSASVPTASITPMLVATAAATAAAVPLAHVCVLAPTPTRAQLSQTQPSLADECAPAVSVAEGGGGEVVLEFRRPVDGCTCTAAAEGGTAEEGGGRGEGVEPLMYVVSGSADGILFDSERVAVSVGCRHGVRPPPTVEACASALCTMDVCPDGMGRRPAGDECCSCLAADGEGGAGATPPPSASPAWPASLSGDAAPVAAASDVSAVVLATAVPGAIAGLLCVVAVGVLVLRCRMRSRLRFQAQLGEHEEGVQVVHPDKGPTLQPTSAKGMARLGEGKGMAEHSPPLARATVVSPPGPGGISNYV